MRSLWTWRGKKRTIPSLITGYWFDLQAHHWLFSVYLPLPPSNFLLLTMPLKVKLWWWISFQRWNLTTLSALSSVAWPPRWSCWPGLKFWPASSLIQVWKETQLSFSQYSTGLATNYFHSLEFLLIKIRQIKTEKEFIYWPYSWSFTEWWIPSEESWPGTHFSSSHSDWASTSCCTKTQGKWKKITLRWILWVNFQV